ncbi:MAG: ATP-binding protein [Saprospiraceae bacterium]|nr:ATP-binding protein [Saprospiraceae bacterium]
MALKNLPLGISTLSLLLESNCIYVDKTEYAFNLINTPGRFFLSRPRRFGKSLFVDTLKEIFEGNQKLFEGLYIYDKWDWTKKYPVIKFDFAEGILNSRKDLDEKIHEILFLNEKNLGVTTVNKSISGRFAEIIKGTREKYGERVVVLVDEYDKPILDNIGEMSIAKELRDGLKNVYSVLKSQDANLQFIFMTGVTKFSKVNLFSGLNQLVDITIDDQFSSICGYTDNDLEEYFSEHLSGSNPEEVRNWYNGYNWTGSESVYNPYDILLFLSKKFSFQNYWFETGSPTFLIELFRKNQYFLPDLENIEVFQRTLNSFDIDSLEPVTLLFQAGYLTIEKTFIDRGKLVYRLKIPNQEVRLALNDYFIEDYIGSSIGLKSRQDDMYNALSTGNIASFEQHIRTLFAGIPWRNFTNNKLADFEGFYASVLYAFFASLNARIIPEDITNHGQADMTILLDNHIYVMEIKVVDHLPEGNNQALHQIIQRNYAEKYRNREGVSVHEVGLVFNKTQRNLVQADFLTTP